MDGYETGWLAKEIGGYLCTVHVWLLSEMGTLWVATLKRLMQGCQKIL